MSFPYEIKDYESIKFLDTSNFNKNMSFLIIGKSGTGKKVLCEDIILKVLNRPLEQLKGLILTNQDNKKYFKYFKSKVCNGHEYINNYSSTDLEKYDFIILDNVIFGNNEIEKLIDLKTLTIIIDQFTIKYSLNVRQKLSYVCATYTRDEDEINRLYNFHFNNFPNLNKFKLVLDKCSEKYVFLIKQSKPFSIFWYSVYLNKKLNELNDILNSYEILDNSKDLDYIENIKIESFSKSSSSDSLAEDNFKAIKIMKEINKNKFEEDVLDSNSIDNNSFDDKKNNKCYEYSYFDFYKYFEKCLII